MNIEARSVTINTHKKHVVSFSRLVRGIMIGFSDVNIFYSNADHHVKEIEIGLNDFEIIHNDVVIKPSLNLKDDSNNTELENSSITVVILAAVGTGNCNVHFISDVLCNIQQKLDDQSFFIKTSLLYSKTQFLDIDHHIKSYTSNIDVNLNSNRFVLNGNTYINELENQSQSNSVHGSVIYYSGNNKSILCAEFNSLQIGNNGIINFGEIPEEYNPENYELCCFINGYYLAFNKEHHLLKINLSVNLVNNRPFLQNGQLCAKIELKSYMCDNSRNMSNIPENYIKGFIIAFNPMCENETENEIETLDEYANIYNSAISSFK